MSTLSPTGSSRRSPLPVLLAVLLALVIGALGGWWFAGRDTGGGTSAATSSTSSTCTRHPSATARAAALPAPATITVNVYNATTRRGLARATSGELAGRGFRIGVVANDPLHKIIPAPAEVRFGPVGAQAARVVAAQVSNPTLVRDTRKGGSVDFVIGEGFTALSTPAQAKAHLNPSPSPSTSGC